MDKIQLLHQTAQNTLLIPRQIISEATLSQLARLSEPSCMLAAEQEDRKTEGSSNADPGNVGVSEQQGQVSDPQHARAARVALQPEDTLLDASQNHSGAVRPTKKRLPHLPDEIGLAVFSQAEAHLNPVRLMALMNVEGKDSIPPFIAHAASDNRFWRPFSPMSQAEPDAAYAPRFVERWNNMPPQHQTLLKSLWDGRLSAVETFEVEPNVQNDFDIVVAAVTQYGWALEHASAALKNDRNIVMAAVSQNGWALEHASDALKAERSVVLTAVNRYGEALRYASDVLQGQRDVVMSAVKKYGRALRYASDDLKGERETVMAAVRENSWALEYASDALKNERDIVATAVRGNGWAFEYASDALKGDRDIVREAVRHSGGALQHASEALRDDRDIVMEAVRQSGEALQYASEALRGNRDIVMAAVRQYGGAFAYASDALKSDRDIVMAAISQYGWALIHADAAFVKDPEMRAIAYSDRI